MNIPERLRMHVSSQLADLYVKHDPHNDPGFNPVVSIMQITLSCIPDDFDPAGSPEATFKITRPENQADPSTYQGNNSSIRDIVNIMSNSQNSDSAISASWSNGNNIYFAISVGHSSDQKTKMALSSPLLALSAETVRVEAFGESYAYTFPEASNTTAWLPILSYGVITFAKE